MQTLHQQRRFLHWPDGGRVPRLGKRQSTQRSRPQPPAAASADLTMGTSPFSAAIPYFSKSTAKLQSRHMKGSPADGVWASAAAALLRLELMAAAAVDRHVRFGPTIASVLAGIAAGAGLDAFTLLQYGIPQYFQDLLLAAFGAWDTSLWRVTLTAAVFPVMAWAVRCWWAANMQLLGGKGGALQQMQQLMGHGEQQVSGWQAAGTTVARALLLSSSVGLFSRSCAFSSSSNSSVITAAGGLLVAATAAVPLVLHVVASTRSSSSSSKGISVAAPVLGLEAAWVLAMVGVAAALNLAAAAGIAVCLLQLHRQVVAPRIALHQAAAGDKFEAHVSLRLAGTRAAFDSTLSEDPVRLVAAQRSPEQVQAWQQLTSDTFWDQTTENAAPDQQQETDVVSHAAVDSAAAESVSSRSGDAGELRTLTHGLRSWLATPAARWEPLLPFVAEAACGMYLGETRTIQVFNPKAAGYWNPSYSWWQPTADVAAKFKGQMPSAGDMFWYPVADGAFVPTRVAAVGEQYVELDANYGVIDTLLQLEVKLVKLEK